MEQLPSGSHLLQLYMPTVNYQLRNVVVVPQPSNPSNGDVFVSLRDDNLNHWPPKSPNHWILKGGNDVKKVTNAMGGGNGGNGGKLALAVDSAPILSVPLQVTTRPVPCQGEHYALLDVELCNYSSGPVLALGIIHASYYQHTRSFHSYYYGACERTRADYTTEGLKFWAQKLERGDGGECKNINESHRMMTLSGAGRSESEMIYEFLAYQHHLRSNIKNITYMYDDPHADFTCVDSILMTMKYGSLQKQTGDNTLYTPWKCARDIMRGGFRMLTGTHSCMEEPDLYRLIAERWNQDFEYDAESLKLVRSKAPSAMPPPPSSDPNATKK